MESSDRSKRVAEFLVIDSAGFIKNAPLHEYGQELITLHEVIDEIRDKATKQRLQALPYELSYQQPDSESLKRGTSFNV
jgi:RNA-binding protein NOB1